MGEPTQALVKVEALQSPIATVTQFRDRLRHIENMAFVTCPFVNLDTIPANYLISERLVVVSPDLKKRDVYWSGLFCEGTKDAPKTVALTRRALGRLWIAAAGNILWSKQVGDRTDSRVVEWSVGGEIRQVDGNIVQLVKSKRIDLRDGSDEIIGMSEKQLRGQRAHIYELAETKAMLRLVRAALDVPDVISVEELRQKVWACYALVPQIDTTNSEIQKMVVAAQLGIVDQVYGARQTVIDVKPIPELGTPAMDLDGEPETPTQEAPEEPFDLGGVPPPAAAAPPEAVCGCPCGHQKAIKKETAEATIKVVGSPRCQACYPGESFAYEQHKHLASLELKSRPDITPASWLATHQKG